MAVSKIKNNVNCNCYGCKRKHSLGTPEASKVVYGQRESRSVRSLLPFLVDFLNIDLIHILISLICSSTREDERHLFFIPLK